MEEDTHNPCEPAQPAAQAAPLTGLRILDFSTLLPGPAATLMLADLGATVLRIESPDRPDLLRILPPFLPSSKPAGRPNYPSSPASGRPARAEPLSAGQAYLNRGKQSIALNLKSPAARPFIGRLLQTHDILVEQFRPGVMARLGLGYEELSRQNPELIYCSITGYGQTGPLAARAGHDLNYLALTGGSANSGRRGQGPAPTGMQIADVAGGAHQAVMGILAAVYQRQRTGRGAWIDVSMADGALSLNHLSLCGFLAGQVSPGAEGDLLNGGTVYDYYRTLDDRWMAMGALEPGFVRTVCQLLDCSDLYPRILNPAPECQQACKERFAAAFARREQATWIRIFAREDCCVEPVLDFEAVRQHPHFIDRGMFHTVQTDDGRKVCQAANPLRFDGHRYHSSRAGGGLGADREQVLQALGLTAEEIAALRASGLFGSAESQSAYARSGD